MKRGAILIVSSWIILILSLFALSVGYRASISLRATGYTIDKIKALYIAKAGIVRGVYEIREDETKDYDGFGQKWSNNEEVFKEAKCGGGEYTLSYKDESGKVFYGMSDEERKININKASKEILARLPGLNEAKASYIIDWRDSDSSGDAESEYYKALEPAYEAKNAQFEALEELLLVRDITPEILKGIKDYVTIYGDGKVNVNTASSVVLSSVGMRQSLVDKIIAERSGLDGEEGTQDDEPFKSLAEVTQRVDLTQDEFVEYNNIVAKNLLKTKSDFFRIPVVANLPTRGVKKKIDCIVERRAKKVVTKYWHED